MYEQSCPDTGQWQAQGKEELGESGLENVSTQAQETLLRPSGSPMEEKQARKWEVTTVTRTFKAACLREELRGGVIRRSGESPLETFRHVC